MIMRKARDEIGAGTVMSVTGIIVIVVVGLVIVVGVLYLAAAHRARGAADLAALSAAARVPDGGDACGAAERVADRHGAQVTECVTAGDDVEWAVHVLVRYAVTPLLPGLPDGVRAEAWAGSPSLA